MTRANSNQISVAYLAKNALGVIEKAAAGEVQFIANSKGPIAAIIDFESLERFDTFLRERGMAEIADSAIWNSAEHPRTLAQLAAQYDAESDK